MRTTEIRCAQNIGAQFRALWLIQRKRRVADTGAKAILASKGVEIVDPKDIFSAAYIKERETLPFPVQPDHELSSVNEEECHVFTNRFSPIAAVAQVQNLTNSVVRNALPEAILSNASENSAEEDERVKEAILHAHLFDSHQKKLPKIFDVINNPGKNFPREYGIPVKRRNKTLAYHFLLLLDQLFPEGASRHLVEDTITKVTLNHTERLMHLNLRTALTLSSSKPLSALANPSEVQSMSGEALPDIYPLSPFINCRPRKNYPLSDAYGLGSSHFHPHTVFVHQNEPRMRLKEDQFYAISLLHGFAQAAAYARHLGKNLDKDLDEPIVVQVVHNNGPHYHMSAFQLNTLNLTGPTKNVFWTQPWESLFQACHFKGAKPLLEGYNPRVFSLLKGIYAST